MHWRSSFAGNSRRKLGVVLPPHAFPGVQKTNGSTPLKGLAYRCHIVSDITNLSSDFYKKSREAQSETQSDAKSLDWDFSNLTTRSRTGLKLHHPTSYRTKTVQSRGSLKKPEVNELW